MATPSIIFPNCHRISYHLRSVAERYCGACWQWHAEMGAAEDRRRWQAASREPLENLVIAIGMGWDLDGAVEVARQVLNGKEREA